MMLKSQSRKQSKSMKMTTTLIKIKLESIYYSKIALLEYTQTKLMTVAKSAKYLQPGNCLRDRFTGI